MSSSAKSSRGSLSLFSSTRKTRTRRSSALASKSSRRRNGLGGRRRRRRRAGSSPSEVSEKLESLRILIPARGNNSGGDEEVVAAAPAMDRLFQETADYILRLRAQVVVLQGLIQLYGSDSSNNDNTVSSAVL